MFEWDFFFSFLPFLLMEWRRGRERHDVIGGDYFYAKKKNCDLEIGVAAYVSLSGFRSLLEKNQQKQKTKRV